MSVAQASLFDTIQTGDIGIDFLGGGIGNHGVSGKELAAIFGAQAQADVIQAAREREDRKQRQKVILVSGSVLALIILLVTLYYISTKPKTP